MPNTGNSGNKEFHTINCSRQKPLQRNQDSENIKFREKWFWLNMYNKLACTDIYQVYMTTIRTKEKGSFCTRHKHKTELGGIII